MRYGNDTLWGELVDLPKSPKRPRRSWRIELIGVGLLVVGVLCGYLGYEVGGGRLVILLGVVIGIAIVAAGTFLISWGGGHRVISCGRLSADHYPVPGGPDCCCFRVFYLA